VPTHAGHSPHGTTTAIAHSNTENLQSQEATQNIKPVGYSNAAKARNQI